MARKLFLVGPLLAALLVVACNGSSDSSPDPSIDVSPTPAVDVTPAKQITPPMEGPEPQSFGGNRERQNYRENPDYDQPDPTTLPEPGGDQDGQEFHPPEEPTCPEDWEVLDRSTEYFKICYPSDWRIDGHGYVTAGMDDRWYSVGIFKFLEDGSEAAHVSIYVMTSPYSRPPELFIRDCGVQAYQVTLDGHVGAVCPDVASVRYPEARIVHYWVPAGDRWTMINVVPYFEKDDAGAYTDEYNQDDFDMAVRIAQTVDFYERAPGPGDVPPPIPFLTPASSPTPE